MKTKELIKLLQETDPVGETEVVVGASDIYFLQHAPMYYDGLPIILIRDDDKKPYYNIAGFKVTSNGNKITIRTVDFEDVLTNDPNCTVELADDRAVRTYSKQIEHLKRHLLTNSETFVSLQAYSCRGKAFFAEAGKCLDLDTNGNLDSSLGFTFEEGQILRVRWPDKEISEHKVVFQEMEERVFDNGQFCTVQNQIPHIEHTINGLSFLLPIDGELEICLEDLAK